MSLHYSYLVLLNKPDLDAIRANAQKHEVAGFAFKDLTAVAAKAAAYEKRQILVLVEHWKKSEEERADAQDANALTKPHEDPEVAAFISATNPFNEDLKLYTLLFFRYQDPAGREAYTFGWTSEKWDTTGEWLTTALAFLHGFGYRGETLLVDVVEDHAAITRFTFNDAEKKIEAGESQSAEGDKFRGFLDKYGAPVNLLEVHDSKEKRFRQVLVLGLELEKREQTVS